MIHDIYIYIYMSNKYILFIYIYVPRLHKCNDFLEATCDHVGRFRWPMALVTIKVTTWIAKVN